MLFKIYHRSLAVGTAPLVSIFLLCFSQKGDQLICCKLQDKHQILFNLPPNYSTIASRRRKPRTLPISTHGDDQTLLKRVSQDCMTHYFQALVGMSFSPQERKDYDRLTEQSVFPLSPSSFLAPALPFFHVICFSFVESIQS